MTTPNTFADFIPRGNFSCAACGAELDTPGVCKTCDLKPVLAAHEALLRPARDTIPERFRWASFDGEGAELLAKRTAPRALELVMGLFGRRLPAGIVLLGPAGAGKTSIACAMLRRIYDATKWDSPAPQIARARLAMFVSVPELRVQLDSHRRGAAQCELMQRALDASILVLDDLDDDLRRSFIDILSVRQNRNKPTIVTTWLDREAASQVYGERLARRAYEQVISC